MINITAADAINALEEVVAGNEGFVYQTPDGSDQECVYVHNGAGSCGVGKALIYLGVPLEVVAGLDSASGFPVMEDGSGIAARSMGPFLREKGVAVEWTALGVFSTFQRIQDTGRTDDTQTWGVALFEAQRLYNETQEV